MRSEKYPCQYLVGKAIDPPNGLDVYWQPGFGTAVETERGLEEYSGRVSWVPTMGLLRDYNESPALMDQMPPGLRVSILDFAGTVARWDFEERMDQLAKESGMASPAEEW